MLKVHWHLKIQWCQKEYTPFNRGGEKIFCTFWAVNFLFLLHCIFIIFSAKYCVLLLAIVWESLNELRIMKLLQPNQLYALLEENGSDVLPPLFSQCIFFSLLFQTWMNLQKTIVTKQGPKGSDWIRGEGAQPFRFTLISHEQNYLHQHILGSLKLFRRS